MKRCREFLNSFSSISVAAFEPLSSHSFSSLQPPLISSSSGISTSSRALIITQNRTSFSNSERSMRPSPSSSKMWANWRQCASVTAHDSEFVSSMMTGKRCSGSITPLRSTSNSLNLRRKRQRQELE